MELFKEYDSAQSKVIEPQQVRKALKEVYFGSNAGGDYEDGNMGCAQETLSEILDYLHREHVYPNYLEEYVNENNKDKKF